MKMIRRLAVGGSQWIQDYIRKRNQQLEDEFTATGGLFMYRADSGPIDGGHYDDPHKPPEHTDLNKDLEGWEPLF